MMIVIIFIVIYNFNFTGKTNPGPTKPIKYIAENVLTEGFG